MHEDMTTKLLTQATESITKLHEIVNRMDERLNSLKASQEDIDKNIIEINRAYNETVQRLASLESMAESNKENWQKTNEYEKEFSSIDKRLSVVETSTDKSQDRWNKIISFVIQLAWVVLAAWLLTKLNLQAPAVP